MTTAASLIDCFRTPYWPMWLVTGFAIVVVACSANAPSGESGDSITVRTLVLVDSNGHERAKMGTGENGVTYLSLRPPNGKADLSLMAGADGDLTILFRREESAGMMINSSENGRCAFFIKDKAERSRIAAQVTEGNVANIVLADNL